MCVCLNTFLFKDTVNRCLYLHQLCDHRLSTSNRLSENIISSNRLCWQLGEDMTSEVAYPTSIQQRPWTVRQMPESISPTGICCGSVITSNWGQVSLKETCWFWSLAMELHSGYVTSLLQCSAGLYIANLFTINSLSNEVYTSKCIPKWVI